MCNLCWLFGGRRHDFIEVVVLPADSDALGEMEDVLAKERRKRRKKKRWAKKCSSRTHPCPGVCHCGTTGTPGTGAGAVSEGPKLVNPKDKPARSPGDIDRSRRAIEYLESVDLQSDCEAQPESVHLDDPAHTLQDVRAAYTGELKI